MATTLEDRITIAKFMGWYIEIEKIDPIYPDQEWYSTKRLNTEEWDASRCVFINSGNNEKEEAEKIEVVNELWEKLCHPSYGRAGKYYTDWNELMQVVEKCTIGKNIEGLPHCQIDISFNWCRIAYKDNVYNYDSRDHFKKLTTIEAVYNVVLEFIKWYNSNNETDKSQLNK